MLKNTIKRKETDTKNLETRIREVEGSLAASNKKAKDLIQLVHTAEASAESESEAKLKTEKQRAALSIELSRIQQQVEEALGEHGSSNDKKKSLEEEIVRARRELDESRSQHASEASELRRKNAEALAKATVQIDALQREKAK